ncbi:uncharacterized protein TNCV_3856181 [Trichonephila clavipes]|nr:uncharacterized protein TNCV_3856181 [Trichonephila clavipes]
MAPCLITCDDPLHERGVFLIPKHRFCSASPIRSYFCWSVVHLVDEIARDDSVCLAWSLAITHTLTACTETGTPFCDRLVRDTFLPVHGRHPPMNSCRFLTFRCQESDNTSLLLNRRILQRERHPVLLRSAASFGRRFL